MDKYAILNRYFGHRDFRQGQKELIDSILSGRDTMGIMPTGAGKSVCFQVPALMLSGVTIVVSPLISLMKDQVNALTQCGIKSAYINASLSERQLSRAFERAERGAYKIIYVAPERLLSPAFMKLCEKIEISMLCIDEAHCVSHWGHDFRPAYLDIAVFVASLEKRPVLAAFTATATDRVRQDIIKLIGLDSPYTVVMDFDRENLYFEVQRPKDKLVALRRYLDLYSGRSGIIYCSTRTTVDELSQRLEGEGYSVTSYHAGLPKQERKSNQELFIESKREIIIATNAFGMGIDKSNVSFVIHYNMPGDIESYYQEAGRAGRDGGNADCILFYSPGDARVQRFFIDNPEENQALSDSEIKALREMRIEKLEKMIYYATKAPCLRNCILEYFGQKPEGRCNSCSGCNGTETSIDVTIPAKKIFSAIKRVRECEPREVIAHILKGKETEYILSRAYNQLTVFGIMNDTAESIIDKHIDYFIKHMYISVKRTGSLYLEEKSLAVLYEGRRVRRFPDKSEKPSAAVSTPDYDRRLYTRLYVLRKQLSLRLGVPDYTVFTDLVLKEMSGHKPRSIEEMRKIDGIAEYKLKKYGVKFLMEINRHCRENIEKV